MKLFAGSNFRESNVASALLTYCPNCSRDLFFANRRQFAKFAIVRSSRKFSRLQYGLFLQLYLNSPTCIQTYTGIWVSITGYNKPS
ncbi:MAG: hypothetical protein PV344_08275, partial [Anaplasma sp.]|nr:hypothetical protein [Anaplasma sp.]